MFEKLLYKYKETTNELLEIYSPKNQHNTKNNLSLEKRSNMNFLFRREQKIIVFFTKEESFEKNELVNVLYKKYGYKSIYYIFLAFTKE